MRAERGRFRAFLLASLKHFLANEWDKSQRLKRGGGAACPSLDWSFAETKFQVASTAELSPDKAFDREWAVPIRGGRDFTIDVVLSTAGEPINAKMECNDTPSLDGS